MNAPMNAVSNNIARNGLKRVASNTKAIVNDSVAFYPTSQRMTSKQAVKSDSFGFYPSTGATRIPKKAVGSFITKQQQQPHVNYASKYSRSELDAMFAKSRMEAKPVQSAAKLSTKDSMAFYPARKHGMVVNTTTSASDASFGFYSNTVSKQQLKACPALKPKQQTTSNSSSQEAAKENHLSLYAAGSLAMGILVQAGRSLARA